MTCTPYDKGVSPDRIDALVWGIGQLDRAVKTAEAVVPFGETGPSHWKID